MADFEATEFAGGGADVAALVADVVGEALAYLLEEGVGFAPVAFGDELDAAVGEVADIAGDLVAAGDRVGRVPEADALDVAGVVDGVAMEGHCGRLGFSLTRTRTRSGVGLKPNLRGERSSVRLKPNLRGASAASLDRFRRFFYSSPRCAAFSAHRRAWSRSYF